MMENTFDMAKTCCGTPLYLSPELCQEMPYSSKADIWVKVFLFVLLTKSLGGLKPQAGREKNKSVHLSESHSHALARRILNWKNFTKTFPNSTLCSANRIYFFLSQFASNFNWLHIYCCCFSGPWLSPFWNVCAASCVWSSQPCQFEL